MPAVKETSWSDGPFELVQTPEFKLNGAKSPDQDYIRSASYMALMHNILIRGLNTIYQQAPHVAPADQKDFINYSLCFCDVLDNHTRGEDLHMFPEIEKAANEKGLMDFNKEEHDQFEPGLLAFKTHLQSLLTPTAPPFSGSQIQTLITGFSTPLLSHLHSEVTHLVSLSRFGTSLPILKISTTTGQKITKELPNETGFMFFLLNNDATYEGGMWSKWPPIPGLARFALVKTNVARNKGWWRFASCGQDGKPQGQFAQ